MRSIPKVVAVLGALSLALGACSDDSGMGDDPTDAAVTTDAAEIVPDAAPPDATPPPNRSGTIAVLDLAMTNPNYAALTGAAVNISYTDISVEGEDPAYDDRQGPFLLGCAVWTYTVGSTMPQPQADEGDVTISGTLTDIGTCSFDGTSMGYRCSTGNGTLPAIATSSTPQGNGNVVLSTGASNMFSSGLTGARVMIDGFAEAEHNGVFQVVGQLGNNTLELVNPAATAPASLAADGTFMEITGAGPTVAGADFLGGDTNTITISKQAGDNVPEFEAMAIPSGEGFLLDSASTQPHMMPLSPSGDASFSCSPGMSGNCGVAGGIIHGLLISGTTTDGDINGLLEIDMPDPVNSWATFQCRSIGEDPIVLPAAAIDAIMGTSPTRVETQVFRITADTTLPDTGLIVGHGLIGYTDAP